jgi:hypothetical protein
MFSWRKQRWPYAFEAFPSKWSAHPYLGIASWLPVIPEFVGADSQKLTYHELRSSLQLLVSTATPMALLLLVTPNSGSKIARPNDLLFFSYQLREKIDLYLSQ